MPATAAERRLNGPFDPAQAAKAAESHDLHSEFGNIGGGCPWRRSTACARLACEAPCQ
jgi:hypothetical protein